MGTLLDYLHLRTDEETYSIGNCQWQSPPLGPLGKINLLVGANNSGKSRAMRHLCKNKDLVHEMIPRIDRDLIGQAVNAELRDRVCEELHPVRRDWRESLPKPLQTEIEWLLTLKSSGFDHDARQRLVRFLVTLEAIPETYAPKQKEHWMVELCDILRTTGASELENLGKVFRSEMSKPEWHRLYIPTLRSLRKVGIEGEFLSGVLEHIQVRDYRTQITAKNYDLFEQLTRNQYFTENSGATIFTGQTLYDDVEKLLRGNLDDRKKLREFEQFLAKTFFQGQDLALIPKKDHSELTVKIGTAEERQIHQLGDGIQMLLLITFPLFRWSGERVLAFIEEPELFLHPWLQRVLIELLASSRFPDQQYFLTTHSNHLLDLTMDVDDVSVFAFEEEVQEVAGSVRPSKFRIQTVSREDRKPLELLGVRNSSVLLSNCTIWVEGITDRRYLSHWLDLYQKEFSKPGLITYREDLHFSFVEYGGGNITHWSFLDDIEDAVDVERLCGKLFLITDRDRGKHQDGEELGGKKAQRQVNLENRLRERYCCLSVREIENLLTPKVLTDVLSAYGEKKDRLPQFKHEDYKDAALGDYIENTLLNQGNNKLRKGHYRADSGTITDKVKFCHYAVEATKSWEDVSPDAQALVERIYKFIADNHSGTLK